MTTIEPQLADLGGEPDAAAFPRSVRQSHHRTKPHKVAGAIIDRRHWVKLRSGYLAGEALCLPDGHAAYGLHDGVEAAPRGPGTSMAERTERDVNEPWPDGCQLLW